MGRTRSPRIRRWWGPALSLALLVTVLPAVSHADTDWRIYLPTNTGIQGNYAMSTLVDPLDGAIWVAAYDPIWSEGGLARFDGTRWTNWSNVDGTCPTDQLRRMTWDHAGNIWAGSDIGLLKFDGTSFTVYHTGNAPLLTNRVSDVAVDENGNIWFSMNDYTMNVGGLGFFDGSNWTIWTRATGIPWPEPWNGVSCVDTAPGGIVYIGSDVVGAARFDGTNWIYYDPFGPNHPPTGFINDIEVEADGTAWFSSPNDQMARLEGNVWTYYNSPGTGTAFLRAGDPGTLYVGTFDAGVWRLTNDAFTPLGWISNDHVYGIDRAADGTLWASGIGGIGHYEGGSWTEYDVANTGLPARWIDGITHDDQGYHWIGTSGGGVCRFDGEIWMDFNPYNHGAHPWPYNTDAVNSVRQMRDGTVWASLRFWGIGVWNGSSWPEHHLPMTDVRQVTEDSFDRAWAATEGGLAYRNGSSWTMFHTGNSVLPSNDVRTVAGDALGYVWAGSFGLIRTNGVDWTLYTAQNSPLPGNWIDALAIGPDGAVWIGTDAGLARFHNGVWTVYTAGNSPLPASPIRAIAITPDNVVWVGCFDPETWPYPGGLARFEGGVWTVFTTDNSPLPHNQIDAIGIDADNNPWVGTASEGIAVYFENTPAAIPEDDHAAGDTDLDGALGLRLTSIAPNPFASGTTIRFELPQPGQLDVDVFDSAGRRVRSLASGLVTAGPQVLTWDGTDVDGTPAKSGAYFVRMCDGRTIQTQKVLLVR